MPKSRRRAPRAAPPPPGRSGDPRKRRGPALPPGAELQLAQSFRRQCSVCDAGSLGWSTIGAGTTSARLPSQRSAALQLLESGWGSAWAFWWCPRCDQCGAFEPAEHEMGD